MRKRGSSLDSPEANFMFGGPDNEQFYESPDGSLVPYDRNTAAVDYVMSSGQPVKGAEILSQRDEAAARITQRIPAAERIEDERKKTTDAFNGLPDPDTVDQQG